MANIFYDTANATTTTLMMGGDPELFFIDKRSGRVRGSEKVIPANVKALASKNDGYEALGGELAQDGVQVELHPVPCYCRAHLGDAFQVCFRELKKQLVGTRFGISFEPVVDVTRQELTTLSEKSRVFGCAPSLNVHNSTTSVVAVDASKYLKRSAGGHIHLGHPSLRSANPNRPTTNQELIVRTLDALVGNTCVLIDRDENAVERRRNYGKAGEYRAPTHGVEYRTLSNFWLRSYQLMSFVYGMSRMCYFLVTSKYREGAGLVYDGIQADRLFAFVDSEKVARAINTNDFDLAMENFLCVVEFLKERDRGSNCAITRLLGGYNQLPPQWVPVFLYFVDKGIDYWFQHDPLTHWTTMPEGHGHGWESFLNRVVLQDMLANTSTEERRNKYGYTNNPVVIEGGIAL